nr:LEAF RUST 10 DISEASE-RESISTANCE LOCUS RECEPTOR-LIKE PROTEIN KINASE-like 2.7 [Ipomoea batatas]
MRLMLRHCASYTGVYWRNLGATLAFNQMSEYVSDLRKLRLSLAISAASLNSTATVFAQVFIRASNFVAYSSPSFVSNPATSKQFSNSSPFLITALVAKLSASLSASKTPLRVTLELLTLLETEKHLRASQASVRIPKSSSESPKERKI